MIFYIVALCALIIDQLTKFLIQTNFTSGYSMNIIGDFFSLTYVQNRGSSFGIQPYMSPWPVLVSTIFVFGLMTYYVIHKCKEPLFMHGLALILGGAIGNLIDRFRFGYVVDFLNFKVWPVFNVADITITVGVGMVILYLLLYSKNDKIASNQVVPVNGEEPAK